MSQGKRSKPTKKAVSTKQANAKHTLKKKHLSSTKSRNEDIREKLDRDALSLHSELRAFVDPRPQVQLLHHPAAAPSGMDASQSLTDLTATLRNL